MTVAGSSNFTVRAVALLVHARSVKELGLQGCLDLQRHGIGFTFAEIDAVLKPHVGQQHFAPGNLLGARLAPPEFAPQPCRDTPRAQPLARLRHTESTLVIVFSGQRNMASVTAFHGG